MSERGGHENYHTTHDISAVTELTGFIAFDIGREPIANHLSQKVK